MDVRVEMRLREKEILRIRRKKGMSKEGNHKGTPEKGKVYRVRNAEERIK